MISLTVCALIISLLRNSRFYEPRTRVYLLKFPGLWSPFVETIELALSKSPTLDTGILFIHLR